MSTASPKHTELPPVVVPPHLWTRSDRPVPGRALQLAIPAVFVVAGVIASGSTRVAMIGIGVVLGVLIPAVIQHYLESISQRVMTANRATATELRRSLRAKPLIKLFAPAAWITLQEAQLALRLGDGRSAAELFAETSRLCKRPDAVMLVSAQAHALVVAGDRKVARELLNKLAAAKLLGPRDQLDLGVVMLLESHKRSRQAMAYIEAARKTIGDHPRVIAALALALQRAERVDEAAQHLEQAQITLQEEPDPVVDELVNRARRDMRRYIEAQLRRERRARSRRTTVVVTSEHAVSEIVSGEISSRGDSGAVPRASEQTADDITSVVADALADSEALRARGWQDPSTFAGKGGEEAQPPAQQPHQPSVKVELRDSSLGEPIRLETKYALKGKEAPKEPGRRRREVGPAIDIDLSLDEGEDEDADTEAEPEGESLSRSQRVTRPDVPADAPPRQEAPASPSSASASPSSTTSPSSASASPSSTASPSPTSTSGLLSLPLVDPEKAPTSGLLAAVAAGATPAKSERDEGSDLRRMPSLSETLGALDGPSREREEAAEADAPAKPIEADAPMTMRRQKTTANEGSGLRPPPFPSVSMRANPSSPGERRMPTFAPPPGKAGEADAPRPSFAPAARPKDGSKG